MSSSEPVPQDVAEAVAILIALAKTLNDRNRDAFDWSLADLVSRLKAKQIASVAIVEMVIREFDNPHSPECKVTQAEYARRRKQVLQSLQQLPS